MSRHLALPVIAALSLAGSPAAAQDHGEAAHGDPHAAPATDAAGGHGAGASAHHGLTPEELSHKLEEVGVHAVNFALLIGVLVYFGRRPVGDSLKNRRLSIHAEVAESRKIHDEARTRSDEYERRLAAFHVEVSNLVERVRHETQVEHDIAVKHAHDMAEVLRNTTRKAIEEETKRALWDLRREAIDLSVSLAEGHLRRDVTGDDQRRLVDTYLETVAAAPSVRSPVAES